MGLKLWLGDITKLEVDVIVNAANRFLLGGGGVDGAIHRAAGPELLAKCRTLGGCAFGDAKMTPGYNLPARIVLHAVGPIWQGGDQNEPQLLASCYRRCLTLAMYNNLFSIAFPAIGTGIYAFPADLAAHIAVNTVKEWIEKEHWDLDVTFVAFDEITYQIYQDTLDI